MNSQIDKLPLLPHLRLPGLKKKKLSFLPCDPPRHDNLRAMREHFLVVYCSNMMVSASQPEHVPYS